MYVVTRTGKGRISIMPRGPRFGRIYQRSPHGVWWIAYYDGHNRERRESTKSHRYGDAERLLKQRHAELLNSTHNRTSIPTVNELLDHLQHDYDVNAKSSQWVRLVNDTHLRPWFGHLHADKVTTGTINAYIGARRKAGIRNATINRELSLLRRSYNLARQHEPPLVQTVPRIPKLAEDAPRQGFFNHDEYRRLHDALPSHVKPILTFAYYTGTRRGEILSLRWDHVDLDRAMVRLEHTKNGEPRLIPLPPPLHDTLRDLKAERDRDRPRNPWVFTYHDQPVRSIRTAWNNACNTAGLTDEHGKPTKLFHDLRRTGVRNLVRAGVPELVAMRISGHKTRSVFDRYNIINETDLTNAATTLDRYLSNQRQTFRMEET